MAARPPRWELAKRGFSGEGVTSTDSDSEEEVEDSSEEAAADHDPDDDGMELPLPQSLVDALGQDRVRVGFGHLLWCHAVPRGLCM